MHRHQITLHPDDIQTARLVVLNPASFHDDPNARLSAWAALKQARGEQVNPLRLRLFQERLIAIDHLFGQNRPVFARPCAEAPFFDGMASWNAAPSYTRVQRRSRWLARTTRIIGTLVNILTIGLVLATTAWLATVGLEHAAYHIANPPTIWGQP